MAEPPPNSTSAPPSRGWRPRVDPWAAGIVVAQALLLAYVGARNLHSLNADAVAYLRLAGYYASGQAELAVSGYWGPLLSWLIAPLLKLSAPPLTAGRVVMGASAVLFALGCFRLFRGLNLSLGAARLGLALTAAASLPWSVENISPDLLVSGLVCVATSLMLAPAWAEKRQVAVLVGVLWGLAYLAKAVALPLALLFGVLVTAVGGAGAPVARPRRWRSLGTTFVALLLVAGPWVAVLSAKYGRLTFSTSARIAHAVAGPADAERYHPTMRTFHRPEAGRLTAWEDPPPSAYAYWSPFESSSYLRHQLSLIGRNVVTEAGLLGDFDLLRLGWWGTVGGLAWWLLRRRGHVQSAVPRNAPRRARVGADSPAREASPPGASGQEDRWPLAGLLAVALAAVYLPGFLQPVDHRYFYLAYALTLAAVLGGWGTLTRRFTRFTPRLRSGGGLLIAFSYAAPVAVGVAFALQGLANPAGDYAAELAARLEHAHVRGPIAGSGLLAGMRTGLFAAYLLNEPWYGDAPRATAADYAASGARLVIVARRQPVVSELDRFPQCRSLDAELFASPGEAEEFPLKVYEIRVGDSGDVNRVK